MVLSRDSLILELTTGVVTAAFDMPATAALVQLNTTLVVALVAV